MRFTYSLLALMLAPAIASAQTPTWASDIAPIIYKSCSGCHITGGIAPFSLVGYNQAKPYAMSIKSAVQAKRMPPWPADPNYNRHAWERLLSADEINRIAQWVDAGAPSGDLNLAPSDPMPKLGSSIVSPTFNLKAPDYNINTVSDEYRCFVIPTGLTTDAFVTELEIVPGNRKAVHHVLVFADTSSIPVQLDANDPKPGYLGFGGTGSNTSTLLGLWVPGGEPFRLPTGMGMSILKGSRIILQVHYPGGISNQWDSTRVVLKTTTGFLRNVWVSPILEHSYTLQNGPLVINANQKRSFLSKYTVNINATVLAVGPHMHLIGQRMKIYGIKPNLDTQRFVNIRKWDFHWQGAYFFRKAMKIESGTSLYAEAFYDNTASNPWNPNSPPKTVSLGEATTDEMLLAYFWYTYYLPGDENIVIDGTTPKDLVASAKKVAVEDQMHFWPNPATGLLNLEFPAFAKREIGIYNLSGKLIRKINSNEKELKMDVSGISNGIYFLRVIEGQFAFAERLIIMD